MSRSRAVHPWFRVGLACVLVALVVTPSRAQPDDELIDKLLDLAKQKKPLRIGRDQDAMRQLLMRRYNIALDELKERCTDFKKHLATRDNVFEAGRHLLQADLELQTRLTERARVLEKTLDLVRWYERRLEASRRLGHVTRGDVLRVQFQRATLEIDLLEVRRKISGLPPR